MNLRPHRHFLRATGAVGCLGIAVFLLVLGGEAELLPALDVLLTKPPSEWMAAEVAALPKLTEVEALPVSPAPPPAHTRIASQGSQAKPTTPPATPPTEAEGPSLREANEPEPSSTADKTEPIEPKGDPREEALELMRHGGDLVREGLRVPRLDTTLHLRDIETLLAQRRGLVIAGWGEEQLRVIPLDGSLPQARDFRALTAESKRGISDRCFELSGLESVRPLLRRFRRHVGLGRNEPLRLSFYLAEGLNHSFASKQLGAVAQLGIDLAANDDIATQGVLRVTATGASYLIRTVRVGASTQIFHDPEARLLRANDS